MLNFADHVYTKYDEVHKIWTGPESRPLYARNCAFGYIAFKELRRNPRHICQISDSENTTLTNEEGLLQGIRIARAFERLGIKQKDVIGIAGRNTTYLFGVVLGCFFNGTAYHAINPNYDQKTSKHLFDITKPKLIFCDGQDLEKLRFASSGFETRIITLKNHVAGVSRVTDFLDPTGDEHLYQPAILEEGPTQNLAILCSSGSTGVPKAVTISHLNRIWDLLDFLTQNDVQLMTSTMDWLTGLMITIGGIVYGATRIITDKPTPPEYLLELIEKYKITFTIQSPPSMVGIVKCPASTPEKLDSIKYFLFGGCKSTAATEQAMQRLLRHGRAIHIFGFTELNTILSKNSNIMEKPNSVGLLMPGMRARICDEKGHYLGPNEVGELQCQNGEIWAGYYNDVEATMDMYDEERWFHSGDLGYFDEQNYLYIVERKKELLNYRGTKIYPSEVEEVIAQMSDVKEVCVFGIESEAYGDIAAAAVVKVEGSSLTPEDVIGYVREQIEADYMQLHGGCKFFDVIPKTPNGKINRKGTKEKFMEL